MDNGSVKLSMAGGAEGPAAQMSAHNIGAQMQESENVGVGSNSGGGGVDVNVPSGFVFNPPKPTNFFELLSAAVSKAKMEQSGPDFLEFLRNSGIKTAWVRAIVSLYEEQKKPDDPLSYLLKSMGLGIPEPGDIAFLQGRVKTLRTKVLQLQGDNEQLKLEIHEREEAIRQKQEDERAANEKLFSDYDSEEDYDSDTNKKRTC